MFDPICFCCFVVLFGFFFVQFALFFLSGSQKRQTIVNGIGQMAELKKEGSG